MTKTHNEDVRSKQRFNNFKKVLALYEEVAGQSLSKLEEEGLIQRFEYTFELAWKCLQDLLHERGYPNIRGPRPVLEQAFKDGLITDGPLWFDMLKSRNETVHLYDESTFQSISKKANGPFIDALKKFRDMFPQ